MSSPPPARTCCCSTCTCPDWTGTPCSPRCTTRRTGLPSSYSPRPPTTSTSSAPCTPGQPSYLLKSASAEHVVAAVRDAAAGTASLSPELLTRLTRALHRPPLPDPLQPLSPREREVLRLIACGHSNRQIARDLAIGEQTVKTHVRSILAKLGLQDRVQAAIFALRHQADSGQGQP